MSHPVADLSVVKITDLFVVEIIDHTDEDRCRVHGIPMAEGEADVFVNEFNSLTRRIQKEARKRPVTVTWEFAD